MGCGSGMACWRRLRDRQEAGAWARLNHAPLARLGRSNSIGQSRASPDSASFPAEGGETTGLNATDRGRTGSKRHVIAGANGVPLALALGPTNERDSRPFEPRIDAMPPIRQYAGRPRRRPARPGADEGYDFDRCRRAARRRGSVPRIAHGTSASQRVA